MPSLCRLLALAAALAFAVPPPAAAGAPRDVVVFAAASLTNALKEAADAFTRQGGAGVKLSFAATSLLARQVESGARAQLFVSADTAWMDYLDTRGHIAAGTRRPLLGNRLVLVVPADSRLTLDLAAGPGWLAQLPAGRIATGDPAHVPVGRYARQALIRQGLWSAVEGRLARADNVRSALVLVERGEAAAGIVYATDAAASPKVRVAGTFPETSHDAIVYPMALLRSGQDGEARKLYDFLVGPTARAVFAQHKFQPL